MSNVKNIYRRRRMSSVRIGGYFYSYVKDHRGEEQLKGKTGVAATE